MPARRDLTRRAVEAACQARAAAAEKKGRRTAGAQPAGSGSGRSGPPAATS